MQPLKQDKRIGGATTFGQMRFLWKMLDGPKSKYRLAKYSILIVIVIAANAITQVRLNNWQGSIYDAIGQRDLGIFLHEITVFLIIVSILLTLLFSLFGRR